MEDNRVKAMELDYDEWVQLVQDRWGEPKYRAQQICAWIHKRRVFDPSEWTDLSKPFREKLVFELDVRLPTLIREDISQRDGTRKFLWMLEDGETIETVLLSHANRTTACISTQVGCPLGCTFCATGRGGFTRNLSAGEIVGQFLAMEARLGKDIGNIVFMGMGEPLLNLENVVRAIRMLNHPKMRELGIRHMTLSTAGLPDGIDTLADLNLGVGLSVSLHAPTDELRSRIMPVNRRIPLATLMESLRRYQEKTGDRVTFEYLLIRDVNDNPEQAYELGLLLEDFKCFVNLIPFNPVEGLPYHRSTPGRVKEFRRILTSLGVENEARTEKGTDIDAACGQLRGKAEGGMEVAPAIKPAPKKPRGSRPDRSKGRRPDKRGGRRPEDDRPSRKEGPKRGPSSGRGKPGGGSARGERSDRQGQGRGEGRPSRPEGGRPPRKEGPKWGASSGRGKPGGGSVRGKGTPEGRGERSDRQGQGRSEGRPSRPEGGRPPRREGPKWGPSSGSSQGASRGQGRPSKSGGGRPGRKGPSRKG